ncbi:HTH DNA binding domain-containing protein [Natrinema hispanicum]|uniref:HTH DNA binding domain-containing protein n=2 Tax=Natrinema hispanicum TaxID=392421 RepID=A0A1G6MTK9_9EURY|nr:HTH DNA binding domain-containing protein [Natrinema hispanicum]SET69936.1 HTH DNA binding domain-containing protein [Natrinema hispanicum]
MTDSSRYEKIANIFVATGQRYTERARMAHATLTITMPEEVWIHQLSTAYPESTFRVLAAVPGPESGFALVRITGPTVSAVIEAMAEHPQLTELTVAQQDIHEATVHFEATTPLLLVSSRESGVPIELPIEIVDGEATVEVTGSRERLAKLADQLERFGFQYRIDNVRERLHERQLLSERQLEVVVAAVDAGYYDTPRRCSLTDLAAHLDIAKSTCSETLHRAEEAIIKQFVAELPGAAEHVEVEDRPTSA